MLLPHARQGRSSSRRGLTLVEVLIVVALVALVTAGVASGSGLFGATRMRSAAMLILSAIRVGMTHANTTGLPTRLVFDLEERTIWLEETQGRMLRRLGDDDGDPSAGAAAATEAERLATEEAQRVVDGPREPPPQFIVVDKDVFPGRELGRDIQFKSVHTEHDPYARTEGRAYLYFWPGGGTEKAVIVLTRPGDEDGISVVVSSLTGRAEIMRGTVEYDEPSVDFGEREAE